MATCKLCRKLFNDYQGKLRTRCGSCNTKIRRYRAKAAAIKYLGGKCAECGWHGNQAALQFHHIDSASKEFVIGNVAHKRWELIKRELQKCVLLCANCYATKHSSKAEQLFLEEAMNYRGRALVL